MKRYWNKYTRLGLLVLTGIVLILVAVKVNTSIINEQVKTKQIIVAKQDIAPFGKITKEMLEFQEVTLSAIPEDAVSDAKDLNFDDLFATEYGVIKGTPLRKNYTTTEAASKMGNVVGLKEGHVNVAVTTSLVQSAGDGIKPGTYVDVYAYIRDERTGMDKLVGPKQNPNFKNVLVKQRLNAEGIVPDPTSGKSLIPAVAILEVKREFAGDFVEVENQGKIFLTSAGHVFDIGKKENISGNG
ncbi:hypothetical protein J6TS7_32520 [Paenibacillus dendritiformis]|uniref:hypothetical protein n=1 Tax=Paenibacillus TaxID=44249 RepID=UPI001B1B4D20|nr:hypothetical protein [Paenibacillus dendritiformis]GIO79642.1 hypothetical protein J6TS7_32520 [Paenibacillus dendritiformis]